MAGRMVYCNNTINFILPKGSLDDSKYQSRYDLIQKGAFIKIFIFRKAEQKLCFSTYAYVNFHHFCPNNFFLRLEQYFPHHTILNRKLCLQSCTHFFRLWVRNYVWYQIISTFFSQIHCTFLAFFKFTFPAAIFSFYPAFPAVLSFSVDSAPLHPLFSLRVFA